MIGPAPFFVAGPRAGAPCANATLCNMERLRIAYLILAAAGCGKDPPEQAPADEVKRPQPSVERVGALSNGRFGVEVEMKLPQRGSKADWTTGSWWDIEKRELLVWVTSSKARSDRPLNLQRWVEEFEAPPAAKDGEWRVRVLYSWGDLGDGVLAELRCDAKTCEVMR